MVGMTEVGRLFNANELIVAEVLQSAESMKAAVSHLEPHMEAADTAARGKAVLATVKGDVHDIGKNLVEILLANNGFEVVDLGIKVPPERIVEACREHRPDAIGLSGLLVKSAHQMVVTAEDLRAAGIEAPILVGGAALSKKFTETRIAPAYGGPVIYCGDAMYGLDVMQKLVDPERREALIEADRRCQVRRFRRFCRRQNRLNRLTWHRHVPRGSASTSKSPPLPTSIATWSSASMISAMSGASSTRRCSTANTWGCAARSNGSSTRAIPRSWRWSR